MGNEEKITLGCPEGKTSIAEAPENLRDIMLEGLHIHHPSDPIVPFENFPAWIDRDKLERGRKYALEHYASISFSQQISLYLLFSSSKGLSPLIYTKQSGTPFIAFKRYLSTGNRVRSWYESDPLDKNSEAYKNLTYVRRVHLMVSKKIASLPKEQFEKEASLETALCPSGKWAKLCRSLKDDLKGCPFKVIEYEGVHLSQGEMSITQFGFMGLVVAFPEKFGLRNCDEELECFIHLWKVIGYLLGLEDKYNFCNGSLDEIRSRSISVIDHLFKPNLLAVNAEWEHMSLCATEGINFYVKGNQFGRNLGFLLWVLDMDSPRFYEQLSFSERLSLGTLKFTFVYLLPYRFFTFLGNKTIFESLRKVQTASEKTIKEYESKKFKYEPIDNENYATITTRL